MADSTNKHFQMDCETYSSRRTLTSLECGKPRMPSGNDTAGNDGSGKEALPNVLGQVKDVGCPRGMPPNVLWLVQDAEDALGGRPNVLLTSPGCFLPSGDGASGDDTSGQTSAQITLTSSQWLVAVERRWWLASPCHHPWKGPHKELSYFTA